MRICVIVGTFPSLSETFILNQLTGLLDQGHQVRIFAGVRSTDVIVHEDVIRFGLLQHVRFHNDKPASRLLRLLQFFVMVPAALLKAPGVVVRSLDIFRYGREAWSLNLFFKAMVFLEARDYDIVFCHFGPNGVIGCRMKDIGALRGKLVTVFHASDLEAYPARAGRNVYRELFARGDMFLAVSAYARTKLEALGCSAERICIHRMGVDLSQFVTVMRRRFGSGPLKILSVARLVEKKGLSFALEAVAMLAREGIPWEYSIVGDGPLRDDLAALTRHLNISDRVHFNGWQDSGTIRHYLKDADIVLAPSIRTEAGDEEGIPVVLMEAMASGVPVITTPTGGIRELVEDGQTGFLVPPNDPAALAACIRCVWKDISRIEKIAAGGRERIEQEYNACQLNRNLTKIFSMVAYEKK